jgi:hypothetical protein
MPPELQPPERRADNELVTGEQGGAESDGTIEVLNKYQWVGDPRLGRFRVSIDGKAAGFAPLEGSLQTMVAPGSHTARISFRRWYRSRSVEVDVPDGSTVVLEGDIDRSVSVLRRMVEMLFRPQSCLVLKVRTVHPSDDRAPDRQPEAIDHAQRQHSRHLVLGALMEVVGFLLIAVGAATAWPVALVGLVVVAAGFVWTLRSVRARRRKLTS